QNGQKLTSVPLAEIDSPSDRVSPARANGNGRRRHLRKVAPAPPRERFCPTQPGLATSYFCRRRLQHRHAWLRREERKSCNSGFRFGVRNGGRRCGETLS